MKYYSYDYYDPDPDKRKVVTFSEQDYNYQCGDGCCDEYGVTWYVNGEVVHSSPCEDNGLQAVLKHLGIDATIEFQEESGEEICSL